VTVGSGMDLEYRFEASQDRVIGAFLVEVNDAGQTLDVGEYGTAVTFKIAGPLEPAPRLLARVREDDGVTVLNVDESHDGGWRSLKDDHHLLHLTQLLDRVSERLLTRPR
jgi:hypothetical protein